MVGKGMLSSSSSSSSSSSFMSFLSPRKMTTWGGLCCLFAWLMLMMLGGSSEAFVVFIEPFQKECYFVDIKGYEQGISFDYELVDDAVSSIQVVLMDGNMNTLYTHKGKEGRFKHPVTEQGMYQVCLNNDVSPEGFAMVGWSLYVDDPTAEVMSNADATKAEHAQMMGKLVYDLNVNLNIVRDTHGYSKVREMAHLKMIQNTHERVLFWSVIEVLVLIGLSYWQITFLRRMFEVKRVI